MERTDGGMPMKIYRILIVEDDRVIAKSIKQHIEAWGCSARTVRDFSDVMHEFAEFNPHLILMDIGLPFFDGYHWCSEIRKVSQVPVIFISSAADNMNIVMAVSMGGDDFIAKPFDLSVLTAKVQAMLRRTYDFSGASNLIEHRGAILNISDATLIYEGNIVDLTKNEYRILQALMENRGRAVSRDMLMKRLWETDSGAPEKKAGTGGNAGFHTDEERDRLSGVKKSGRQTMM